MKPTIFNLRNFFRVIRMIAGLAIIAQGYLTKDWLLVVIGTIFTLLAIFNKSCCGSGYCAADIEKHQEKEITYEEIV